MLRTHQLWIPALVTILIGALHATCAWSAVAEGGQADLAASPAARAQAVSGASPVLEPVADMTVVAGETSDQILHATDADNEPLSFFATSQPGFMAVSTTDAGVGSATGNIHLAPSPQEPGATLTAVVGVSDGQLTATQELRITVEATNVAPVLQQPGDLDVRLGQVASQEVYAVDGNGDALSFSLAAGPAGATVTTTDPGAGTGTGAGIFAFTPAVSDVGASTVTISVSDGTLSDQKSFALVVRYNSAPDFTAPVSDMTVEAGSNADQPLYAGDPEGDALTFSKVDGPTYMNVTTATSGPGGATGNIHLQPGPTSIGSETGTVQVSDGALSARRTISIYVSPFTNDPPYFVTPPADMTLAVEETAQQDVTATDPDGDEVYFYKLSGPDYMTVATQTQVPTNALGRIILSPSILDAGTATGVVAAADRYNSASASFTITVSGNRRPVMTQPANMYVLLGEVREQTVTATDADGDAISFAKVSGPAFMTVIDNGGSGTGSGTIRLAPGGGDIGQFTGSISACAAGLCDTKSFTIVVYQGYPPVLAQPQDMTVKVGVYRDQYVYASDADGDCLSFNKVSGPPYLYVYSYGGCGTGTGLLRLWYPTQPEVTTGTVSACTGGLCDTKSFAITVTPELFPVLTQPADMSATAGEVSTQTVTATDADGDYIYIEKVSGPPYMTAYGGAYGTVAGTIRLAPGDGDVGTATGTIRAYSGSQSDSKSFAITVQAPVGMPSACGEGSFAPVSTNFAYGLLEAQTADLNQDGWPDIVVEAVGSGRAFAALGTGDGRFGTPQDLRTGPYPNSGVIADFNGDGAPDVAISDDYLAIISVSLGDGTGQFAAPTDYRVGYYVRSVAAADMDGDGKVDLLASHPYDNRISLLRGKGDGTFLAPTPIQVGGYPLRLATPDLDEDGAPDIAFVDIYGYSLVLLRNTGGGTFQQTQTYGTEAYAVFVDTADLNADGHADLVVCNNSSSSVSAYLGNGDGTLRPGRSFLTADNPNQVTIGDLNGDGHPDLATTSWGYGGYATVLLGDGTGGFGARRDVPAGNGAYGIVSADFDDDLRLDLAVAAYEDGTLTVLLNHCAPDLDHPPVVRAPRSAIATEGSALALTVTATDPDGPAVTDFSAGFSGLPLGHDAVFAVDPSHSAGTFTWTPSFQDARALPYEVTFTAVNVIAGSATTRITVQNTNRAPVANAGGPYTTLAGYPVSLDGTGSQDPDGDALTYQWVFGDGVTGVGPTPLHTYAVPGIYAVALTVSDGGASGVATTTVNAAGVFEARAFTGAGNRSIRLGSGKPQWCAYVEPVGQSYSNSSVMMSTVVMKSPGTGTVGEIHALSAKAAAVGDQDGNGVEEITTCFAKTDLRQLFSSLHGTTTVTVSIEGNLLTGGLFRARMDVTVVAGGGGSLAVSLSPNPLNPEAVLTFVTGKPGPVHVEVFDLAGRRVRRLLEESNLPSGYHDLRIDARGDDGAPLASGVYFYRIDAIEGTDTGRFTILK